MVNKAITVDGVISNPSKTYIQKTSNKSWVKATNAISEYLNSYL